jgi:hypothetical protein
MDGAAAADSARANAAGPVLAAATDAHNTGVQSDVQ